MSIFSKNKIDKLVFIFKKLKVTKYLKKRNCLIKLTVIQNGDKYSFELKQITLETHKLSKYNFA